MGLHLIILAKNHTMKYLFVFLLVSMSFIVISQNKEWSIGLIGAPNFYNIKPMKGVDYFSYENDLGLTIGLETVYSFNQKLNVGIGTNLTNLAYQGQYNFTFIDPGDPVIPREGNIKLVHLDIPVFARMNVLKHHKIGLYPCIALNSSFLIDYEDETTFEDNSIRESGHLNSFLLSAQISLGLMYKLNDKISLRFEPRFRKYFKGFDELINRGQELFQTVVGIEYKFGKED